MPDDLKASDRPTAGWRQALARVPWAPLFGVVLFGVALYALHQELHEYRLSALRASIAAIPWTHVAIAGGLTVLAYLTMTGYDALALRYISHEMPYRRIALASFVGYAFSNNVGLSLVAGSGVRYRLYSSWGLSPAQFAKLVAFYSLTPLLGLATVAGVSFVIEPLPIPAGWPLPFQTLRPFGIILISLAVLYLALSARLQGRSLKVRSVEVPLPTGRLAAWQLLVAALDWTLSALVLYALLPAGTGVALPAFLAAFLLALVSGQISQVPGGLGVFETVMLVTLGGHGISRASLVGSLLAFRAIFFIAPLLVAAVLLGLHEAYDKRHHLEKVAGKIRSAAEIWAPELVPWVFAVATFIDGALLILSGATPTAPSRLRMLQLMPLVIVESSRFLASIAGLLLLILARGLVLRLDAAYHGTLGLLGLGIVVSMLTGDPEQAVLLLIVLLALWPAERAFYRKARLFSEPLSPRWTVAVTVTVAASIWLGLFSFRHVRYSNELWWKFALNKDAPRFLRASVGVVVTGFVVALLKLFRPAPIPSTRLGGDPEGMARARPIVAQSPRAEAYLALLGDKHFLFDDESDAFVMYGIEGRSFIALGDPIGPPERAETLVRRFRELADRQGGWAVFQEVSRANLGLYVDLGMTLLKMGEHARVDLAAFTLEGSERKRLRQRMRTMEKANATCEVLSPEEARPLFPTLREISDAWLAEKHGKEKGFSLGRFDERYLPNFPLAVVRMQGAPVAFANLWATGPKTEVAVDLMRYHPEHALSGTMEYLFIWLMLWAKEQGYQRFNLGMAPLAGLESHALAPAWNRIGALVYRHGAHFYNFQGLRDFKQRFDPEWEPKYLAYPGGVIRLPQVITDMGALTSGGVAGIVGK